MPPYLLVPDPLLLEPVPELESGLEPMPLELGLGVLLLLEDPLLDGLLLDGLLELEVPPLELLLPELLLPDLLNAASHSWREIEPSLFLSTDENVGVEPLAPLDALLGEEELGEAEEELDAPPEALPDDLLSVALGLELGEEELGEAEEELDAPPEALPDDLLLSVALGLALDPDLSDEVLCAAATPASAKSAAAVAV